MIHEYSWFIDSLIDDIDILNHNWHIEIFHDNSWIDYISHRIHGTGIFTYIYHKNQPNVGRYTIHGSYGFHDQRIIHDHFLLISTQEGAPGPGPNCRRPGPRGFSWSITSILRGLGEGHRKGWGDLGGNFVVFFGANCWRPKRSYIGGLIEFFRSFLVDMNFCQKKLMMWVY